jgi:hypothetical protein
MCSKKHGFFSYFLIVLLLGACSLNETQSKHPAAKFFYPILDEPKIYVYRDMIGGLEEQFHRVYAVKDQLGHHVVVERYASDGRILEALNFNVDSLDIQDHMVVNRNQKKTQAVVYKTTYFPWKGTDQTWFATKFEGVLDSTLILQELKRMQLSDHASIEVMGEQKTCIKYKDLTKFTLINPFAKTEKKLEMASTTYYAEGLGLVEWKSKGNKVHFRLEQIMDQTEWLKFVRP